MTFLLYLFCRAYKDGYKLAKSNLFKDHLLVNIVCIYLASLRPTGAFLGIIVLLFFLYRNLKKLVFDRDFDRKKLIIVFINLLGILFVTLNFAYVVDYTKHNLYHFTQEPGLFFGYPREILRSKLNLSTEFVFINLKNIFYTILWKLTEFVSGLSDIRDTHSSTNIEPLLPFIARTFTGVFILYPINILSTFGLISNWNKIFYSEIWILLIACFISISPSLLGIANSRYLMMVYTPFMIFGAQMLFTLFRSEMKYLK